MLYSKDSSQSKVLIYMLKNLMLWSFRCFLSFFKKMSNTSAEFWVKNLTHEKLNIFHEMFIFFTPPTQRQHNTICFRKKTLNNIKKCLLLVPIFFRCISRLSDWKESLLKSTRLILNHFLKMKVKGYQNLLSRLLGVQKFTK